MSCFCNENSASGRLVQVQLQRVIETSDLLGVDFGAIAQVEVLVASEKVSAKEFGGAVGMLVNKLRTAANEKFQVLFVALSVLIEFLLTGELPVGVHYALVGELGNKVVPEILSFLRIPERQELVKFHATSWLEKVAEVHSEISWQNLRRELVGYQRRKSELTLLPDWPTLLVKSFAYFWRANQRESFQTLVLSVTRILFRQKAVLDFIDDLMNRFDISDNPDNPLIWYQFSKSIYLTFGSEIAATIGESVMSSLTDARGILGAALRKPPNQTTGESSQMAQSFVVTVLAKAVSQALTGNERDTAVILTRMLIQKTTDKHRDFRTPVLGALLAVSLQKNAKLKAHPWSRHMVDLVLNSAHVGIESIVHSLLTQKLDDFRFLGFLSGVVSRGTPLVDMDMDTVIAGCTKFRISTDALDVTGADENVNKSPDTPTSRKVAKEKERLLSEQLLNVKNELVAEISLGNRLLHEFRKIREMQIKQEEVPEGMRADKSEERRKSFASSPAKRKSLLVSIPPRVRGQVGSRLQRSVTAMNEAFGN